MMAKTMHVFLTWKVGGIYSLFKYVIDWRIAVPNMIGLSSYSMQLF